MPVARCLLLAAFTIALSAMPVSDARPRPQDEPAAGDPASARLAAGDRAFLRAALERGQTEVAAGKLATERAASDAVKRLGEEMVRDHRHGNERLMALIRTDPSFRLPRPHRDRLDGLTQLQGDAFDQAYLRQMHQGHARAIALYAEAMASVQDPKVREFARQTLPTLRRHAADTEALLAARGRGRGTEGAQAGPRRER
ncbi:DUF4142 domain-containing protein [Luteimonas sp. R10]|uniref:DUF4142 domain-containing protein n=1 Tax=Luteimonas sp. R10 TaxID=3108176 RepID=UPI003091BDCA|nr:DUF4142 domain-containing protein [Luteimonas sp. R10]